MSLLVSHPTGNANVRNALLALEQSNLLGTYVTSVAVFDNNILGKIKNLGIANELKRREYDETLRSVTISFPCRELARLSLAKLGLGFCLNSENSPLSVMGVYRQIDKKASRLIKNCHTYKAAYAYEDGALATFVEAKKLGLTTYYELPTTYWRITREILFKEAELEPEWASTLPALTDSEEKLERKDLELQQADHVICASNFCADSLQSAPFQIGKAKVIPYGCPSPARSSDPTVTKPGEKLKILFVGNLSQGKGLSYLFDAIEQLGDMVELSIIGNRFTECPRLDKELEKHNWLGTMTQQSVLQKMQDFDLLVFPSLLEGFGMVITEALSQGLPVITTPHSCAPEIIEEGVSGHIVPIRDASAIAEKISQLYDDREQLQRMKLAAMEAARKRTWKAYHNELVEYISGTLSPTQQRS